MTLPPSLTTKEAISQVYAMLGRPNDTDLPPGVITESYWRQLDKTCLKMGLSDRTYYLNFVTFQAPQFASQVTLNELTDFANELALEWVAINNGVEDVRPVPLLGDFRDVASTWSQAACIFRDPNNPAVPILRFVHPLDQNYNGRLWYEPGSFARPGKNEQPGVIPKEAFNYTTVNTAFDCLRHLSKVYIPAVYTAYKEGIAEDKAEFTKIFDTWLMKDPTHGLDHNTAFNERRRSQGRYGGIQWPIGGRRNPIIGDPSSS